MATLVYIHGESYEWNSGNLYDGTVLAAHSNIIVVTINFRLGVLGEFLNNAASLVIKIEMKFITLSEKLRKNYLTAFMTAIKNSAQKFLDSQID